ncbi:MAG: exo-1,3-beta-glucanase [Thelocarpon superellum]|nr:MAG: exo-1,3-beta-glucanase [Thelocarpon superellum]
MRLPCVPPVVAAALFLLAAVETTPTSSPNFHTERANFPLDFDYTHDKVRGVNLGGWFVLEPWITPSLFAQWQNGGGAIDEYTFCQELGPDEAFSRLNQHWSTWITRDDFFQIAHAGLNHVRIPVGYWAITPLPGEPYVQGQLTYLDQSIGWARDAGLKVLIDLHGAPGSQNGADNSGRAGPINWGTGDTIQQTLDAVRALAERYATSISQDVVTAIQPLNEPRVPPIALDGGSGVKSFDYNSWGTVRDSDSATVLCIHDAFLGTEYWQGFMNVQSGVWDVMLDTHQYQVFSVGALQLSAQGHVQTACDYGRNNLRGLDKWTIVGEWSGAATDCAKWLNGLGRGARYDGTYGGTPYVGNCVGKYEGSVADMLPQDKDNLGTFIEAQMDAYEQATGWIFWTWKTESAPEWNFQDLLANGLIPQPITSRRHGNQCGY